VDRDWKRIENAKAQSMKGATIGGFDLAEARACSRFEIRSLLLTPSSPLRESESAIEAVCPG
jgi:hypothetical protein